MSKAANTRIEILSKAFGLVYRNGFQATSVDDIIATTQVTKGAFFYHFRNKDDMGLAMIQEVMYPGMHQVMVEPLANAKNPVAEIYSMMKHLLIQSPLFDVKYGCPAVNLIEEMSPLNESYKAALLKLVQEWQQAIENCIRNGKANGAIRQDVDPKQVAYFVTAGYNGIRSMGKVLGQSCYKVYLQELKKYMEQLQ
jgi:TetR/AcrR family transcriptional regulator, transcriptional repressor for nem operon